MNGQTVTKVEGKLNGILQTKIWKPGAAKEGSHVYGQQFREARRSLNNKVWDLGKIEGNVMMTRRSSIFLPWEFDAGESSLQNIIKDQTLRVLVKNR